MSIRRATVDDAAQLTDFLRWVFKEDPEAGGNPDALNEELTRKSLGAKSVDCWLFFKDSPSAREGKLLGTLSGQHGRAKEGDPLRGILVEIRIYGKAEVYSANYFPLLAVDHTITHEERVEVSRALTLFAADDLKEKGLAADIIWIVGPYGSRGNAWGRMLGVSEVVYDPSDLKKRSDQYLPFALIWERANAVSISG